MKWIYAFATIALFATSAFAYDVEEDGEARLGYIAVANDGATSLTFNATSIQNAVILGLFLLVLGALILPLFTAAEPADDGYSSYGHEQTGYQEPATGYESGYAKRSLLSQLSPVMDALSKGYKKYEDDE